MEKIEVLRSDESIRNNICLAMENAPDSKLSDAEFDSMKISALLEKTKISNVGIEEIVDASASNEVLIGSREGALTEQVIQSVPDDREVYTFEYSQSIKNNKPLENNYIDEIRGNVIKIDSHDSTYMREYDYNDHQEICSKGQAALTNTHGQYKKFFLVTDAINHNKISNCFRGRTLKKGAALSFWVKFFSLDTTAYGSGLLAFLGDHKRHYFDIEGERMNAEYVDYTAHLSVSADLCVTYDEAFWNTYSRKRNNSYLTEGQNESIAKVLWRSDKAWMHVALSFTDEGIERFVNGMRVTDDYSVNIGKRFGKHGRVPASETECRMSILDFLSSEDTVLFLGLTLDERKTSESMLFDDITFWDEAINSDEEAKQLIEEAVKINLP